MPRPKSSKLALTLRLVLAFYTTLATAVSSTDTTSLDPKPAYKLGDAIPVSCLNRTAEGEHITDSTGALQYIPFPVCQETNRPLEFHFGSELDFNCTLEFIDDAFFHILEYYVHNDSPFTCRIPARPFTPLSPVEEEGDTKYEGQGSLSKSGEYIPIIIALTGTLQLSHLHIASHLNVLLHAAPKATDPGVVAAGTAYSVASPETSAARIVIGDALALRFSVRWYPSPTLPSGWMGVGGHVYFSTLVYCLLSAGAATAVCIAYFRGVELPRRLRSHGKDRMGGTEGGRLGGYGYGVGNGGMNGFGAVPKRD